LGIFSSRGNPVYLPYNKNNTTMDNQKCCLCEEEMDDMGNNPEPLMDGPEDRCCDYCNRTKVVPARLGALLEKAHSKDDGLDQEQES